MFCARCGRDFGEKQDCDLCGWTVSETDIPLGVPAPARSGNGVAIASLVCGVASLMLCGGGFVIPIIGIVLGIQGLKSEQPSIAMAGIILNAAILAISVLMFLLFGMLWIVGPPPPSIGVPTGRCC